MKTIIFGALFALLAVNASAGNMYVGKDGNGRTVLTNVTGNGFFERLNGEISTEIEQKESYYSFLSKNTDAAIGMNKAQVRNKTNWGEPNKINTTINAYGTHEQWVYDYSQYLYFDNGKLTTIQQ